MSKRISTVLKNTAAKDVHSHARPQFTKEQDERKNNQLNCQRT